MAQCYQTYYFTSPGFIPKPLSSWTCSNFTISIVSPLVTSIDFLACGFNVIKFIDVNGPSRTIPL